MKSSMHFCFIGILASSVYPKNASIMIAMKRLRKTWETITWKRMWKTMAKLVPHPFGPNTSFGSSPRAMML